jgi:hypothetical protein
MRNRIIIVLTLLFFSLIGNVTIAHGEDVPHDVGYGISYDSLSLEVLGVSPQVAGSVAAIVVQSRWSDLSYVAPGAGAVTTIVRWPRLNEQDDARAVDAAVITTIGDRGQAIVSYHVPAEVLLPGEDVVTATVELRVLAISALGFPNFGWGQTDFTVAIGRAQ